MFEDYYIHYPHGWEKVKGQRVKIKGFEDIYLFSHPQHTGAQSLGYSISEVISGCHIDVGKFTDSRIEAITLATAWLKKKKVTQEKFKITITKLINKHGKSPLYSK